MKKLENIHSFALKNTRSEKVNGGATVGPVLPTYVFVTTNDIVADGSSYSDVECIGD